LKVRERLVKSDHSQFLGVVLGLLLSGCFAEAAADSCILESEHAGMSFPVNHLTEEWACRLKLVVDHYTTATSVGPLKTAMNESVHRHLLDHPPMAAALINRLDLAPYKAEARGSGRWWGNDGDGTEGIVQLVYHDRTNRIYYLEGTHHSRLLPNLSGKAVVFLRMAVIKEPSGLESMHNTMVAYTMLDNRILSGLASLVRPLVGATVTRKLAKGVNVVNRLGLEMRQRPDRVLFEAMDPPPLPDEDVAFLKNVLGPHVPITERFQSSTP
jgi:hypothetical protein